MLDLIGSAAKRGNGEIVVLVVDKGTNIPKKLLDQAKAGNLKIIGFDIKKLGVE